MKDEYLYRWAQWGVLNLDRYRIVRNCFGDLERAWRKMSPGVLYPMGFGRKKTERIWKDYLSLDLQWMTDRMNRLDIYLLHIQDSEYPVCLRNIPDAPPFLFVRGKLPAVHKALGVVGTRTITDYGKYCTEKLTSDLVHNGFTIVSGLAMGVDACAHATTLLHKGITVGVLGTGADFVYPKDNIRLAQQILESGGALVSEYPLGTPPLPHHFPARNRIISGLSRGVLVIEGGIKSGALITAGLANEQGRDVFAVPNNITKRSLSGTNKLIRKGEAKLVECIDDILEDYKMEPAHKRVDSVFSVPEKILLEQLAADGKTIDELILITSHTVAELSANLTTLQLKHAVRSVGQKWVLH
jgi:DNA processing protein